MGGNQSSPAYYCLGKEFDVQGKKEFIDELGRFQVICHPEWKWYSEKSTTKKNNVIYTFPVLNSSVYLLNIRFSCVSLNSKLFTTDKPTIVLELVFPNGKVLSQKIHEILIAYINDVKVNELKFNRTFPLVNKAIPGSYFRIVLQKTTDVKIIIENFYATITHESPTIIPVRFPIEEFFHQKILENGLSYQQLELKSSQILYFIDRLAPSFPTIEKYGEIPWMSTPHLLNVPQSIEISFALEFIPAIPLPLIHERNLRLSMELQLIDPQVAILNNVLATEKCNDIGTREFSQKFLQPIVLDQNHQNDDKNNNKNNNRKERIHNFHYFLDIDDKGKDSSLFHAFPTNNGEAYYALLISMDSSIGQFKVHSFMMRLGWKNLAKSPLSDDDQQGNKLSTSHNHNNHSSSKLQQQQQDHNEQAFLSYDYEGDRFHDPSISIPGIDQFLCQSHDSYFESF